MTQWEDRWHYPPELPLLGDYIQIYMECFCTKSATTEGIVTGVDPAQGIISLTDEWVPLCDAVWRRWRRRVMPAEVEKREREEELV